MKLTVAVKLTTTTQQARALLLTLERANDTANYISQHAWQEQTFGQWTLHKSLYYILRERFALPSQIAVRAIAKVADAYKLDKKTQRVFRPHGSIAFDERILHWYICRQQVSITTLQGRQHIPFLCDNRALDMLQSQQGETDLVYRNGEFFLFTTVNREELPPNETKGWLGVDLGIVNLLTDSEGAIYSGNAVERNRRIHAHRRRNLQRKQTRSAHRKLRKIAGKQARYQHDTNHVNVISKRVVAKAKAKAKAQSFGIALEDLGGIRERVTVRARQRARHANWAFYQLRQYITYKAFLAGIPVCAVDPRNTSRQCSECGYTDKANRKSQSLFLCGQCNFSAIADYNAALNIRVRARAVDERSELSADGSETSVSRRGKPD
jgi:putative transposase